MPNRRRLDPAAIDLNLLRPLAALLEERQITRAAEQCGVSQPAMSRSLERLRTIFDDELLIRGDRDYELTPRAEELRLRLQVLMPQIDRAIRGDGFDPARSRDRFRVTTPEYGSIVILPHVLRRVAELAPRATIEVAAWHDGSFDDVHAGTLDLAIGGLECAGDLQTETILTDELVCVVGEAHASRSKRLTLETYVALLHVGIAVSRVPQPWIDRPLSEAGLTRKIGYLTPSVAAAFLAVRDTNMILTVGSRFVGAFPNVRGLRTLQAPPDFEAFRYGMAWHPRLGASPPHEWFRSIVRDAAAQIETTVPLQAK